jgi:2-phosphoglycerate kinase
VIGPDGARPFMRGILVQSLTSRGVPFDVAVDVSNAVRDEVAQLGDVELEELARLAEKHLPDKYDLEAVPLRPHAVPTVTFARGEPAPFSKGILANSLQGAGLDPNDAYEVARELEAEMLREGVREIDRVALRDRVAVTIDNYHGPKAAGRYRTWRAAAEDGKPIFLLLGGSTGVGKTSIAVDVARRLEIPHVIGTDSIRQIMRLMFSRDLLPEIHSSTYDAYESRELGGLQGDRVIPAFREQAQKIAVGVHALLDRAVEENYSMMIEGVNVVPGLLDLDRYKGRAHVILLVVAGLNEKTYRSRFQGRADQVRHRAAERYLEHFDEILAIQDHVLSECEVHGTQIIDNVNLENAVLSVIRSVIASLSASLPRTARTAEGKSPS